MDTSAIGSLQGMTFAQSYDPDHREGFVDVDEWRENPVPHRYVHGGFTDSHTRFSMYCPPAGGFRGRFQQHVTPFPVSECTAQGATGAEDKIGFAISAGAFFLETNGGGEGSGGPASDADPTYSAYRANAACAMLCKYLATLIYPDHVGKIYGYLYGGSGGAYRTFASAEHTEGVWDGFVPFVPGSPMALPNVFSVRMYAQRVLRNKFADIVDALEPGGSGDPYATLNEEEAGVLREATRMGFPIRSWFGYRTMGTQGFTAIYPGVKAVDPTYTEDFWTKSGYLGTDPASSVGDDRFRETIEVVRPLTRREGIDRGIVEGAREEAAGGVDHAFENPEFADDAVIGFVMSKSFTDQPLGLEARVLDGEHSGREFLILETVGDAAVFGHFSAFDLECGTHVELSNDGLLAVQTYHRHQVPPADSDYRVWDQFRNPDGTPIYPQRPLLVGPVFARSTGCSENGSFHGKMIVLASALDRDSFAWQADWFMTQVAHANGGSAQSVARLWYTDNALHGDDGSQSEEDPIRIVSYLGVLQEALLQLADWVENDVPPCETSGYRIDDGQLLLEPTAAGRHGVQPVAKLMVNGAEGRCEVAVGEPVTVRVEARSPEGAPGVDRIEWAVDGREMFTSSEDVDPAACVERSRTCRFDQPGEYFVAARVTSQRAQYVGTELGALLNVVRARVVVR